MTAERHSSFGPVLMNTRPAGQQDGLNRAVAAAGARAVPVPLLTISAIGEGSARRRVAEQVGRLDTFDMLVFVSVNAVRYGHDWIRRACPRYLADGVRQRQVFLAVGEATAAAAQRQFGVPVAAAGSGAGSEALLRLPQTRQVEGKRIAIFRAQDGREALAAAFRERGAGWVEYVAVYRRERCRFEPGQLPRLMRDQGVNVVLISSADALACFKDAVLKRGSHAMSKVADLPADLPLLMVTSPRLATLARASGFADIQVIDGAYDHCVVQALQAMIQVPKPVAPSRSPP